MLACLEEIVGVSKTDCACITEGLTNDEIAALKVSKSGLYIDELPGGIELKTVKGLDNCRNLAQKMLEARNNAITQTEDDLIVAIAERLSKSVPNYLGTIGRPSYAVTLSNARQFQGIRLQPRNHTDATVTINRLQLIGNNIATLNVYIVRTLEGTSGTGGVVVYSHSVTTSAGNYAAVTLPTDGLILPLQESGYVYEYWIYFDKALTPFLPKDTKLGCNCSSSAASTLDQYFNVEGISFVDPANMLSTGTLDEYSHGIILDVDIRCKTGPLICREYGANEEINRTLAQAVNFKAGELTIEAVMKSAEVNRFTLQAKEYNWGKRNHFRSEYAARITFIASSVDPNNSDCFQCKQRSAFFDKIRS